MLRTVGPTVLAKAMAPSTSRSCPKRGKAAIDLLYFVFCFLVTKGSFKAPSEISNIGLGICPKLALVLPRGPRLYTGRTSESSYNIRIISTNEREMF